MPKAKTYRIWLAGILLAGVLLILQSPGKSLAQDQDNNQDPPSRVARMNYAQGSVSFQPGGEGDWVNAVPNRPLTSGDNLWTDQGSRAELHIGSTALRLGSETSITLLDLDDRTTQVRLSQGTLILRVRDLDDYGRWQYVGGYGTVWVPSGVGSDWAPYRNGHWVYIDPWGWTWVEDEPWGFAPFHYGRWAFVES